VEEPLVIGPLVRHVDTTTATVWVEVARAATVTVRAGEREASARTFGVHGHHYAVIDVDGLVPGSRTPYVVEVDGERAWPPRDAPYPDSILATLDPGARLRMAFGSCRTSVAHDEAGARTHGIDALRAYALRMAGATHAGADDPDPGLPPEETWPALVLFLGDQVYADETTAEMQRFIEARRDIEQPPGTELADYQEYAELYRIAWSDPANRWLLSTLPSLMIFDDHDIRDDWNTSRSWKDRMEATSWWHDRIVAGLGAYWVHQHLGNLSPAVRSEDPLWQRVTGHAGAEELDLTAHLDAFAERADQEPTAYRWSFARDFGDQARLVVVDSRASRVLEPDRRSILDEEEMAWLDGQLRGDVEHLLVGTSLPFLLAPGLHHVEAFSEALAEGAWGRRAARAGEFVRQVVDLEHWAAFQEAFREVAEMTVEVAVGKRGRPPRTVTFLSGDVHHSYVSEAVVRQRGRAGDHSVDAAVDADGHQVSRILQAVCSPMRNPLPRRMRFATAALSYGLAGPLGHLVSRSAHVPAPALRWGLVCGPWFDNTLATLEITDDGGLRMWWARGEVADGNVEQPRLGSVAQVAVGDREVLGSGLRGPRRRFRRRRLPVRR
jgi:hypothetical protein